MLNTRRIWWAGGLVVALLALVALALPTGSEAEKHEQMMGGGGNHFKCYPILDWGEWDPQAVALNDQFGKSEARVMIPKLLCNPVDKNGEGVPNKDYHTVCYEIHDDPSGPTERVKEVTIRNQFHETPMWVGMGQLLCVPSDKRYDPRG